MSGADALATGAFGRPVSLVEKSREAQDDAAARRLWEESARIAGLPA